MNANTLFPLATIALLAVGIARGALCAPDPGPGYGEIRQGRAGVSDESRTDIAAHLR